MVAKAVTDAKDGIQTLGEGFGEFISNDISTAVGQSDTLSTKIQDGSQKLINALTGLKSYVYFDYSVPWDFYR